MKTTLLLVFLNCFFVSSAKDNYTTKEYLQKNLFGQFISHFQTREMALDSLISFSLGDTIGYEDLWYDIDDIDSTWSVTAFGKNADYVSSLKIKACYWVLKIYNADTSNDNSILVMLNPATKKYVFDYRMIEYREQLQKINQRINGDTIHISSNKFVAIRDKCNIVHEKHITKWTKILKKHDLKYMQKNSLYPFENGSYFVKEK